MRVLSLRKFHELTWPIIDWEFDGPDGVGPASITGMFDSHQYAELVEFCSKNDDFHIISYFWSGGFNKPIPGAAFYRLGRGDKNPNLIEVSETANEAEKFDYFD